MTALGNQRFDGAQDLEGVERLHEVGVGSGFVSQERVDLSVEEKGDRPRLDIAHLLTLLCISEVCGTPTLPIWRSSSTRPGSTCMMAGTTSPARTRCRRWAPRLRSRPRRRGPNRWREGCPPPRMVHGGPRRPTFRGCRGRVSRSSERGYHAAVLEIRVDRLEGADYAQLSPEGELDAYSVAACEAFAELGEEARLIVNLGGVQFMDSPVLVRSSAVSERCGRMRCHRRVL